MTGAPVDYLLNSLAILPHGRYHLDPDRLPLQHRT